MKSWKLTSLNFRVLTLVFTCPTALRTANSMNTYIEKDRVDYEINYHFNILK